MWSELFEEKTPSTVNIPTVSTLPAHVHTSGNPPPKRTHTDSHTLIHFPSHTHTHTHTYTHSWLTRLPLATSQSHAPFLPVWNVGAAVVPGFPHFSVNDTEAGCTKEVCPIEQRLSDQPPSQHTHIHTQRNTVLSTGLPGTPSGRIVLYCQPIKHGRHSPWELERLK